MGRPTHTRSLSLWANGVRIGRWSMLAGGVNELQYDHEWMVSSLGRPLSLSLPFNEENRPLRGEKVQRYFDNLLPEGEGLRRRIAERFSVGSTEPFALLNAIGRDCVGAVQILGENECPEDYARIVAVKLSEDEVERYLVQSLAQGAFSRKDSDADFRLSLAGAQEKTALLMWKGAWHKPYGATPTTHILKFPLGLVGGRQADFSSSVDNEWLCLQILKGYGLPVADAKIATFGKQRVLAVERFDRRFSTDGSWIMRLPQEDFCQALGCSTLLKYENEGGPGLRDLFSVLRYSVNAQEDMKTLLMAQILFWLLRAPDGHAKNFSIHLLAQGRFRLTPLYDVMSAYPAIGQAPSQWHFKELKLAMALLGKNRHYKMAEIQRRHFVSTAKKVGYPGDVEMLIEQIIEHTPTVIAQVQSNLPSEVSAHVAEAILEGLESTVQSLQA